ncbi:MAG: hypothetical protein WD270_04520 [Acetobacterales bacterium]
MAEAPRVLFVTPAAFNKVTGGGVTFTNLFRGWPLDRLATVHCDPVPTSDEVCVRYYRLGPQEIAPVPWLSPFVPAAGAGRDAAPAAAPAGMSPARRAKRLLFGDGVPRRGRLTPALEDWIAGFRPDVLYTILGGNPVMEIVEAIRARFALPLVVHFMDDWPAVIYRGGLLSGLERTRMERLLHGLVGRADACLGIGDAMCRAFAGRFGREFLPFQNPVEAGRWSKPAPRDSAGPVMLVYTGSVYADAQGDSLVDVAGAVAALAREGMGIRMDIHAPDFQLAPFRRRLALPNVRLLPPIEDDAVFFARLSSADMLVLPVNFDRRSVEFIRYSMPTKVPAYLASGTPVLVFGPAGVAQVDYARDAGWGRVVSVPDRRSLQAAIREVANDAPLRARLVAAAERALPAHDATAVRPRFQQVLIDAARAA